MKNLWAAVQQGAASGVLAGGYPYAHNNWYIGMSAPVFGRRIVSLTDLFKPGAMEPGDIAFLGPQAFHEDNLVIPAALTNITLIGAGNRGACYIEPTGIAANGLKVLANDVTLLNIGLSKDSRADYALQVGDATLHPDRFRAYGCKIEGGGVAGNLYGAGDVLFDDCEFAWCDTALQFRANAHGFVTQVHIRKCRFHNFSTAGLAEFAAAQQVNNLNLEDCSFDRQEDGSAPTDFILLSDALNTGYIHGNRFAHATNAAAVLTIGAGILWGPNGTEAGWSTARPA